jgi:hypothetical protein
MQFLDYHLLHHPITLKYLWIFAYLGVLTIARNILNNSMIALSGELSISISAQNGETSVTIICIL